MTVEKIVKEIEARIAVLEEKDDDLYHQMIMSRDNDRECDKYRERRSKVETEKSKLKDMLWAYESNPYK